MPNLDASSSSVDMSKLEAELYPEGSPESVETPEVETPEVTETIAPVIEKVKVGEEEYTQEELNRLVSLGKIGAEAEDRFNTKIDRVFPEFTKSTQRVKELEDELARRPQLPENEEQAVSEAKAAARKLGIVTEEAYEELLEKSFKKHYERERSAERLLDEARGYEKEFSGADGRPAFKTQEVLQFMADSGARDMKAAYQVMHREALDAWAEKELGKAKKPGLTTQESSAAGGKKPAEVKITKNNLGEMISEALNGNM